MLRSKSQAQDTMGGEHRGPSLGVVALIHVLLLAASLALLYGLGGAGSQPEDLARRLLYYYERNASVICVVSFLQFGAAIPLGIFTGAVTSRLRFLGVDAAGVSIALVGGVIASVMLALYGLINSVLSQAGVADTFGAIGALHLLAAAVGGVGTVAPFGLLVAGVSVAGGLAKLLPRWIMAWGLTAGILAELATLSLLLPQISILIPIAHCLGLLWMIAAGFALPKSKSVEAEVV